MKYYLHRYLLYNGNNEMLRFSNTLEIFSHSKGAFKPNKQRARTRAFFLDLQKLFSAFKPNKQRAKARTRAFFLDLRKLFSAFTPKYQ